MILFLKILLAHLVGDFILQSGSWVSDKNRRKIKSPKLFIHTGIHAILLALVLEFNLYYWKAFILIITSHLIIDLAKSWLSDKRPDTELFFLDQSAHITIIAIATLFYHPFEFNISGLLSGGNVVLATALVFVTFAAAVIVKASISQWNPVKNSEEDGSLSRAGRFIGIAILTAILYLKLILNFDNP